MPLEAIKKIQAQPAGPGNAHMVGHSAGNFGRPVGTIAVQPYGHCPQAAIDAKGSPQCKFLIGSSTGLPVADIHHRLATADQSTRRRARQTRSKDFPCDGTKETAYFAAFAFQHG